MVEVLEILRRIEKENYGAEKAYVLDTREDDVGLLKHPPPPLQLSPDSEWSIMSKQFFNYNTAFLLAVEISLPFLLKICEISLAVLLWWNNRMIDMLEDWWHRAVMWEFVIVYQQVNRTSFLPNPLKLNQEILKTNRNKSIKTTCWSTISSGWFMRVLQNLYYSNIMKLFLFAYRCRHSWNHVKHHVCVWFFFFFLYACYDNSLYLIVRSLTFTLHEVFQTFFSCFWSFNFYGFKHSFETRL